MPQGDLPNHCAIAQRNRQQTSPSTAHIDHLNHPQSSSVPSNSHAVAPSQLRALRRPHSPLSSPSKQQCGHQSSHSTSTLRAVAASAHSTPSTPLPAAEIMAVAEGASGRTAISAHPPLITVTKPLSTDMHTLSPLSALHPSRSRSLSRSLSLALALALSPPWACRSSS